MFENEEIEATQSAENENLLKYLEAEARRRILSEIQLTGNGFECRVMMDQMVDKPCLRVEAIYLLNGKRMETTIELNEREANSQTLLDKMRDAMAKDIADNIIQHAVTQGDINELFRKL